MRDVSYLLPKVLRRRRDPREAENIQGEGPSALLVASSGL
jgi:hypothetical protein